MAKTATTLEWFGTATFRVRDAGLNLSLGVVALHLARRPGPAPGAAENIRRP